MYAILLGNVILKVLDGRADTGLPFSWDYLRKGGKVILKDNTARKAVKGFLEAKLVETDAIEGVFGRGQRPP